MGYAHGAAAWRIAGLLGLTWSVPLAAQTAANTDPPRTPSVVPSSSDLAPVRVVPPSAAIVPTAPGSPARELGKPDDDVRIDIQRYELDASAPAALRARLADLPRTLSARTRVLKT